MPTIRSLSVLLFVLVSGGGAWWLLKGGEGPGVGEAQQAVPEGEHAAASLHANDGATAIEQKDMNAGERAAIAAPRHAVTGPAIVGRVVDSAGKAIVEAALQCTPSNNFDPSDFADGASDIDKWAARARDLRQQRTETKTDADGRFRLAMPANGTSLALRVAARGLVIHAQTLRRPDKGDYDAGTLTLKPAAIVSGRVLDRADKPVAKVTVRCDRGDSGMMDFDMDNGLGEAFADLAPDDASTLTDGEGRFELAHVTPGTFVLSARDAEHPTTRRKDLQVEPGGTLADIVLTLEPGATIRGKVVGVPDGVKGLRVLAARREGTDGTAPTRVFLGGGDADMDFGERGVNPAADATFTLRGLVLAKSYRVFLTQRGVGFMGSGACSPKVDVVAGAEGVELRYEPGITVTFHVVDARSQAPVERLWVGNRMQGGGGFADFVFNQTGRARAYEQGAVTLANLRPKKKQTLSLSVEATGFKKFAREGIELPLRGALDLGTVQLQPVPVVRVQVASALDGQPVVGALVQVAARDPAGKGRRNVNGLPDFNVVGGMGAGAGSPLSAKTDVDGRCTVNAIPGAEVVVSVTSSEFAPYASPPLALPETSDAEHSVRLLRGGSVVVDVVDADGKPAAKANVSHRPAVGEPSNIATDAQGRATFVRLASGEHRFRVGRGGDQPSFTFDMGGGAVRSSQIADASSARTDDWKKVEVVDGVEAALRLILEATAKVTGIVRENGKPLVGAEVGFVAGSDAESPAPAMMRSRGARQQTDDQGRYQLADVRTGEHRLRVTHRERAMPALVAVSLRAGDNVFDIDLDMTVLRGVVRGPDDKPVTGASVRATEAAAGSEPSRGIQAAMEANAQMFGGRRDASGGPTKTDAQGRYELRGVSAERSVVVKATAKGLASGESKPVTPARGSTTEGIDVRLSGAGAIRVRSATDVAFAAVQATFLGDDKSVAPALQMLNKGEALLESLRPGRWKVRLGMPGDAQAPTREVDVQAGATSEVSF